MQTHQSTVHRGNFYAAGLDRLRVKLASYGITVPTEALLFPPDDPGAQPFVRFTRLDHAMLDWFEGRDYEQAQALIHFQSPSKAWCVVCADNPGLRPDELDPRTIAPDPVTALAGVIWACDRNVIRIDGCVKQGDTIAVLAKGETLARIVPLRCEPFALAIRDRVRVTFKGVRARDIGLLQKRADRIPGLSALQWHDASSSRDVGYQLFSAPGSWAIAMRGALAQVGIVVKLHQAQELSAVYFGASDWHQLVRHQNEVHAGLVPIGVSLRRDDGSLECKYYWTAEEAVFAVGRLAQQNPNARRVRYFGPAFSSDLHLGIAIHAEEGAPTGPNFLADDEPIIDSPIDGYWTDWSLTSSTLETARSLLPSPAKRSPIASDGTVLYAGPDLADLIRGIMRREGIPTDHLVMARSHACAVEYREGGVSDTQVAVLHVFGFRGVDVHRENAISMYKAETSVEGHSGHWQVIVRPEYGHDEPVVIEFDTLDAVERLFDLTHAAALFSFEQRPTAVSVEN